MANIRIPQYERKVQLNANQSPAVRLAEPIPEPDYGKAIQQAGAAIASIGSSVNAIGDRLQQQNFALIEAEYDNAVQQSLEQIAQTDITQPEWGRRADEDFKTILDKAKESLKQKYPSYFTEWEGSDRGKIAGIKTQQAFGKVKDKLMYDNNLVNMNTLLDQKITNVLLTGEDVSGKAFDDQLEQIISPYSGFLTEQDRQRERNKAAARAYGLYIDKKIHTGSSEEVNDLIKNLKAQKKGKDGKGTGEPEYFKYMTAEDRARYIDLLERNIDARKGTLLEDKAEKFRMEFLEAVETQATQMFHFKDKEGKLIYKFDEDEDKKTPTGILMSKAAFMLEMAENSPLLFCQKHNISGKQLPSLISYMREMIKGNEIGAKAVMDFDMFRIRYNSAIDNEKTTMTELGSLYDYVLSANERGWSVDKNIRDQAIKIKTDIENEAAKLVKDDDVRATATKLFDTTNDEYVRDNLPKWVREARNYGDEDIPDNIIGQAYLFAYSYMARAEINIYDIPNAATKEKIAKAIKDYLQVQLEADYPGKPDGAIVNITSYGK